MKHCVHSIVPIYPLVSEQIDSDETKKKQIEDDTYAILKIDQNNRQ